MSMMTGARIAGVLSILLFASSCKSNSNSGGASGPSSASGVSENTSEERAGSLRVDKARRDLRRWESARDGDQEDLAALAVEEGGMGLVEATADADLRLTALRAMPYARGWAHLPFLATVAGGSSDDEAHLALTAIVELASRVRRAEDPEDAVELHEGCEQIGALARDTGKPRGRRVLAIRALRMMPCAKVALPSDLDAR